MITTNALNFAYSFLKGILLEEELVEACAELKKIAGCADFEFMITQNDLGYKEVDDKLARINEKEVDRKKRGVYYTPCDVVKFIISNTVKVMYGLVDSKNISSQDLSEIPAEDFGTNKTVLDPTCGAGEFLLATLMLKIALLRRNGVDIEKKELSKIIGTIHGNDINEDSICITKIRLFLYAVKKLGMKNCIGISGILNKSFTTYDFASSLPDMKKRFDIIVGNPPYVEDGKSGLLLDTKYGNIYANVLEHSGRLLKTGGCIGFIIPISYISTPRMKKIREKLISILPEQYILSYADRPDCLFDGVHQKLSILIGNSKKGMTKIYTGNYQYWYQQERKELFKNTKIILNDFYNDDNIPKIGTSIDADIFNKILMSNPDENVYELSRQGDERVYINRREAFWIKAYRHEVKDPEYKVFCFDRASDADYCYCLVNSSLFWWYWISVSDCWHISKDLNGFRAPKISDTRRATKLANDLIRKLEETKVYVGTKQTEYEYKHKACLKEIGAIDKYINEIYNLTPEESLYIRNFAIKYRTSGEVASIDE